MRLPSRNREARTQRSRIVHLAKFFGEDGQVSAMCYPFQRPIDMQKATWTIRPEAVTCRRCRAHLEALAVNHEKVEKRGLAEGFDA